LIVAVSDEPKAKIDEFIKKHGCTYCFISAPKGATTWGIKAYPTQFTIDAHGKISGSGFDSLLKDCDMPPAAEYSKKFDKARAAIKLGDFKTASAELAKLDKDTGADGDNAKALEKWIEDHGTKRIAEGDAAREQGDIFSARDAYAEVQKMWAPKADCVKAAKDKATDLKNDKDCKKALSMEKAYVQAVACEDSGDKENAAALFAKCSKATAGTKFAEFCDKKASANK
jgi:hypothetical protein